MSSPFTQAQGGGVYIEVWARPKASKSSIEGVREGALCVKIAAPPTDNAANEELIRFLAKTLGLPKRDLELASGHTSRHKRVLVKGVDVEALTKLIEQ